MGFFNENNQLRDGYDQVTLPGDVHRSLHDSFMYITREGFPVLKRKQKVLGRDNKGLQFRHQLFKKWIVQST